MRIAALAAAVATACLAAPVAAQTPDFSGTWRLDRDASEFPERPAGFGLGRRGGPRRGGGRAGGAGGFAPAATLVITQTSDLLTIEQRTDRGNRALRYRLDGGESASRGPRGDLVTTSSWDGATLLTVGTLETSTPRGDFSIDVVEQRSLDADGRTLTVDSLRMLPFGEVASKLVYRRQTP